HLLFALRHAWVENNPDDLKNLTGGAVEYRPNAASDEVRAVMRRQIERFRDQPDRELVWLKALAARATADDLSFLLKRGWKNAEILAALASAPDLRGGIPEDATFLLEPLIDSPDNALSSSAIRL